MQENGRAPKVSVIVPVKNGADYIGECIGCLKSQTFGDFEALICVDASSTDGSSEAALSAAAGDSRFSVLSLKEGTHLAGNRNLGLDHARGEFVWFLDVDDWFAPDLLESCIGLAERERSDLVIFNAVNAGPGGKMPERMMSASYDVYTMPASACMRLMRKAAVPVTAWSKFAKRSVIEGAGLRFSDSLAEDVEFTYRLLSICGTVTVSLRPMYAYRRNTGSITSDPSKADRRGRDEVRAYCAADATAEGIEDPAVREEVLRSNAYMKMRSAGHMGRESFVEYVRSPEFAEMREKYLRGFEGWGCFHFPSVYHWGIRFYIRHFYKHDGKTYMRTDGRVFRKALGPKH